MDSLRCGDLVIAAAVRDGHSFDATTTQRTNERVFVVVVVVVVVVVGGDVEAFLV